MKRLEDFEEYDGDDCIFECWDYGPCAGFTTEIDHIRAGKWTDIWIPVRTCEAHELVYNQEIESTEELNRDENYQFARVDFS